MTRLFKNAMIAIALIIVVIGSLSADHRLNDTYLASSELISSSGATEISDPLLEVNIQNPRVIRCADNKYYIDYINKAATAEPNAKVRIKLDKYMQFVSSSIPVSKIDYPYLEFNIGVLNGYQSGNFNITVHIDCASTKIGQAHCVKAEILPKYLGLISPDWSRASIQLDAKCEGGKAKFRITNIGNQDMTEPTPFGVIEDDIMPGLRRKIKLNTGQYEDFEYPANGKCYRMIADQVKNHPGHSNPTVALEACGVNDEGTFSTGYYLLFPEDEADLNVSIDCQVSEDLQNQMNLSGIPNTFEQDNLVDLDKVNESKTLIDENQGVDIHFSKTSLESNLKTKIQVLENLKIFPNPASDLISVLLPDVSTSIHLSMYDPLGRLVWSGFPEVNQKLFKLSLSELQLENGMYRVFAKTTEEIYSQVLIINRH